MQRFNKILFVVDGSKGESLALRKVVELAGIIDASVTLIGVIPDYPNHYYMQEENSSMFHIHKALRESRMEELEKLLKSALPGNAKLKTDIMVKEGTPHIEIIRTVLAGGFDLLAKANHNDSAVADRLFGTLDMKLLRHCPCPVYILKPGKKIRHARILAAVDLIRSSKKLAGLDRIIMELATSMADIEEGTLDVVNAWHLPHEKKLKNDARIALAYKTMGTLKRELRQVQKRHLADLEAEYAASHVTTHLVKGDPEDVIPRIARRHRIDLVVMGTLARTGIRGFFIGNTAERILHRINTSVLAVKPEGFVSPVK